MASNTWTSRAANGQQVTAENRGWFLALGIGCIVLGIIALGSSALFAVASLVVLGLLLAVGGAFALVGAFRAGSVAGTIMELVLAVMFLFTGVWLVLQPLASLLAVTTLVASYLFLAGLVRVVFALFDRGPGWGWTIAGGLVGMLLAILIWIGWPVTGLHAIGLFIAIDLIVGGAAWVAAALAARRPRGPAAPDLAHARSALTDGP